MKKLAEYILIAIGLLIGLVIVFSVSQEMKNGGDSFFLEAKTGFTTMETGTVDWIKVPARN